MLHSFTLETMENTEFYYVEVPRQKVQFIDAIIEIAKNSGTTIENDRDWFVIERLFEFFKKEFPLDYANFLISVQNLRSQHNFGKAFMKEGEAMIQHQLEIPEKFAEMIMAVFPDQKFDKEFVKGLAKTLPILKVASSI